MFNKILIANRGEIAVRVIRACREMNIKTVVVHSTADEASLGVQFADEHVCIGGPRAQDSYLNMSNIMSAAVYTGCDALHPGYGLLSENAEFAALCEECDITFIGPRSQTIALMGDKASAREMMQKAGVPVVPGSDGVVASVREAAEVAERIGYPVLVKASAGGGGRGMREVADASQMEDAYVAARAEAQACFGDGRLYVEKLVVNPKHIEFQVLADVEGTIIHLGERECSIQRNHQKMLEESPSKALSPAMREEMGAAAVRAAMAAGYVGAGTVEFVVSGTEFYFIEMNTRIQVEHPVTEMVSGVDLVKEQIRVASGLPLGLSQEDVLLRGHSIECRINAEDPHDGFRPCPGTVGFLHLPGGCGTRVDTALYNGYEMSPFYDSLAAKVIVWAPTRLEAVRRMRRALEELTIEGLTTNLELEHLILFHPEFLKGTYDTGFMARNLDALLKKEAAAMGLDVGGRR